MSRRRGIAPNPVTRGERELPLHDRIGLHEGVYPYGSFIMTMEPFSGQKRFSHDQATKARVFVSSLEASTKPLNLRVVGNPDVLKPIVERVKEQSRIDALDTVLSQSVSASFSIDLTPSNITYIGEFASREAEEFSVWAAKLVHEKPAVAEPRPGVYNVGSFYTESIELLEDGDLRGFAKPGDNVTIYIEPLVRQK